jgi:4-aminobutyrate aminotransferase-like enzyme
MSSASELERWLRRHGPTGPDAQALFVFRAEGARVWLVDGRELLDFGAGGVLPLGHNHALVRTALGEATASRVGDGLERPERIELMHKLAEIVPGGMNRRVRLCDSGREAMAQALALARGHTGRNQVVYLAGMQGAPECGSDVAAMVVHPLDSRFAAAATVCRERGALLVDDESLLAPGMSGQLLGVQGREARPDIVVFGQGLGAGLPFGTVVTMSSTLRWSQAGIGGSIAACRVALGFLELLETGLLDSVCALAAYLETGLAELTEHALVQAAGGAGLALVLRLARPKAVGVAAVCRDEGLLVGVVSESVLAIEPPMVASREEVDEALAILSRVLARFG